MGKVCAEKAKNKSTEVEDNIPAFYCLKREDRRDTQNRTGKSNEKRGRYRQHEVELVAMLCKECLKVNKAGSTGDHAKSQLREPPKEKSLLPINVRETVKSTGSGGGLVVARGWGQRQ